jgi:hypothetical protein
MHVRGIFYDLAKAFYCVSHEILLSYIITAFKEQELTGSDPI